MLNRWFHSPRLHSATSGEMRRVGWLELFYDLIYVAAFILLGNALADHVDLWGFLTFAGVFAPMWLAWTDFTFFNNRFVVDDFLHRSLVFAQMYGIGGMAVAMPSVLDGEIQGFLMAMASVQVVTALLYTRVAIQLDELRDSGFTLVLGFWVIAVLWLVAGLAPAPWNALIAVAGVAVNVFLKLMPVGGLNELSLRHPPDVLHMSERYGLLTLIVLGESFVKVLGAASAHDITASVTVMAGMTLAITFSLWWIYFDDVAGSRIKRSRLAGYTWVWAHLPLTIGVTGVGVAIKKALYFDPMQVAPLKYRVLLAGTLILALVSVAVIDTVTERRDSELSDRARVLIRLGSAGLLSLVVVTAGSMSALTFVGLVSGVCVLQVIADLSMAPMADPEAAHHEEHALWDAVQEESVPVEADRRPKSRFGTVDNTVRKGIPNAFRRDLYYHLMEGSWTRLFVGIAAVWVLSNVFFGALYLLEPGSVSSVHDDHFLEAFSFSVQTMSSIGYGVMAPQTDYAHVIVAVEALVGLIGIALATGLVFAKASRPSMSVMFSEVAVIHDRDGHRTLEFRVGNARGTEVVEASIYVAVLIEEKTVEGHTLRRLHDLKLHREMTPMFALTWSVMHTVDADSPLHGVTEETCNEQIVGIVCTLTGHDATYGQTAHSRHVYDPHDIRFDQSFVDVISDLPDGRLLVDFSRFHDTRPDSG